MVFTDDGLVYKMKVHEVPDAAAASRGKAVVNLIQISTDRKLAGVVPVREFAEGRYVLMVTRKGVIKKTSLADFQNIRSNGIIAINIDEGDELLDVVLTDGTKRIFIATNNGFAIRFDEKNARPMGRATRGTRGIDLRKMMSWCRSVLSQRTIRSECFQSLSSVMGNRRRSGLTGCSRAVVRVSST
jgi:DNA gyrase subunit A